MTVRPRPRPRLSAAAAAAAADATAEESSHPHPPTVTPSPAEAAPAPAAAAVPHMVRVTILGVTGVTPNFGSFTSIRTPTRAVVHVTTACGASGNGGGKAVGLRSPPSDPMARCTEENVGGLEDMVDYERKMAESEAGGRRRRDDDDEIDRMLGGAGDDPVVGEGGSGGASREGDAGSRAANEGGCMVAWTPPARLLFVSHFRRKGGGAGAGSAAFGEESFDASVVLRINERPIRFGSARFGVVPAPAPAPAGDPSGGEGSSSAGGVVTTRVMRVPISPAPAPNQVDLDSVYGEVYDPLAIRDDEASVARLVLLVQTWEVSSDAADATVDVSSPAKGADEVPRRLPSPTSVAGHPSDGGEGQRRKKSSAMSGILDRFMDTFGCAAAAPCLAPTCSRDGDGDGDGADDGSGGVRRSPSFLEEVGRMVPSPKDHPLMGSISKRFVQAREELNGKKGTAGGGATDSCVAVDAEGSSSGATNMSTLTEEDERDREKTMVEV